MMKQLFFFFLILKFDCSGHGFARTHARIIFSGAISAEVKNDNNGNMQMTRYSLF